MIQLDNFDSNYYKLLYELYNKKIKDKSITWLDIANQMNSTFNLDYSESKYRKEYKNKSNDYDYFNFESLNDNKDNQIDVQLDNCEQTRDFSIEDKLNLFKEAQILRDERNQLNQIYRQASREQYLKDIAINCAEIIAKEYPFKKFTDHKFNVNSYRQGILEISDWHYGIEIDNLFNKYSPEICLERVNKLLDKTIDLCQQNNIKNLNIVNLGDMISGRIHAQIRIQNREDVVSQIINVSEILSLFLYNLSKYVNINYYDCLDNHSRIEPDKKESLRLESLARIITWYLKQRFENVDNVTIHENNFNNDIIMFKVFDFVVAGVHGDLDKQKNVIKNLQTFMSKNIDLICTAHMHHFTADEENGCMLICNPSLMGMDQFAEEKRLFSKPAQTFIVSTEDNIVESIHRIIL